MMSMMSILVVVVSLAAASYLSTLLIDKIAAGRRSRLTEPPLVSREPDGTGMMTAALSLLEGGGTIQDGIAAPLFEGELSHAVEPATAPIPDIEGLPDIEDLTEVPSSALSEALGEWAAHLLPDN